MIKVNQDEYAYAAARVRAREVKLLDSSRLDRMLEASSPEEAYKILAEAEYGVGSDTAANVFSFEALLAEEMKKTYSLLSEIAPQVEIVRAFQKKHDYFNVKVLLKAEFSNQDPPPILMETGTYGADAIRRIIRERDYKELEPVMQQAILETYDVFSRTRDPQAVDLILDKASYEQFVTDLKNIDSPFLHGLAEIIIDITNIKMHIRARSLNKEWVFIKKLLLAGGELEEKHFAATGDKPIEAFVDDIRYTKYGDAVYRGWELYKTKNNFSALERLLDDYLMEYVRRAKMITMGVEPFIAYLYAKEAEIRNVRVIMTGKINRLPNDLIRERLRLVYV